ncbi:MAG: aminopeptidase P family protein [Candidatus Dormibacteraeota bacterium]|nr:aminopeptidase P family protein [Candidatus Dormibacteraeota bacterium]
MTPTALAGFNAWMAGERVDAAFLTSSTTIAHLTGFRAETMERLMALAVSAGEVAVLIVPEIEGDPARAAARDVEVLAWKDGEDPYALVAEVLGTRPARLAVETEHLTLAGHHRLEARVRAAALVDATPVLTGLRLRKTPREVKLLEEAARITDQVTGAVIAQARAGMTEIEIGRLIDDAIQKAGAELSFPSLVQAGPASADPHHRPTPTRLRRGDLLLLDFGAAVGGYCADTTRTVCCGVPTPEQQRVFDLVLRAHDQAIAAVRPGVTTGAIDEAARRVIREAGHAAHFFHRVGHGLGLEEHEAPSLDPGSSLVVEPGMVFTIEPGIYIPGWGGIRIEDDLVVTENGSRLLTGAARELVPLPA